MKRAVSTGKRMDDLIVYRSDAMDTLLRDIEKVAPIDVTMLLLGESGTGKELLAKRIHEMSPRATGPFVTINCPAIPETLLESELFGYEKGAFTGALKSTPGKIELANRGTLFLDEVGDIPLSTQVKLLRFLQEHTTERVGGHQTLKADIRIVCATHRNLEHLIEQGRFREDLYYRINQVAFRVPPLRERGDDAVVLASHFLERFRAEYRLAVRDFSPDALNLIATAPWPGNVRQIENQVKRAAVLARGLFITAADLGFEASEPAEKVLCLRRARLKAEVETVRLALEQTRSNVSRAAKLLGISRPTLYAIMRQHGGSSAILEQKGSARSNGDIALLDDNC